jgi:isochorismate synthase
MSIDESIADNRYFATCVLPREENTKRQAIHFSFDGSAFLSTDGDIQLTIVPFHPYIGNEAQLPTSQAEHAEAIVEALHSIETGVLEKVVISCIKHAKRSSKSLDAIFQGLIDNYTNACVYVINTPQYGTWMGATPELLLRKKGNEYHTVSLAGTQAIGSANPLTWSDKLCREQSLVTDFILQTIDRCGASQVNCVGPYTAQAGPLAHLKTDIHFSSENSSDNLIDQLQPTPAVCGLPREAARAFILAHTPFDRRLYAGRLGMRFSTGDEIHFVNLRCMQVFSDHFEIHVGGGIVAGSTPEDEWHETELKANVLRNLIH